MHASNAALKHTPYLAIEVVDDLSDPALQALSPTIMSWSSSFWLVDLRSCASYWSQRAQRHGLPVTVFFQQMICELYGDRCRAALAPHPWQAVLMVREMSARDLQGLLLAQSPFGQTLLHDLSWSSWWDCVATLAEHFVQVGRRHFNPSLFRRQCRDMRRAMGRLGTPSAGQLRAMPTPALARRFGSTLGELRDWAYTDAAPPEGGDPNHGKMRLLFAENTAFTSGFPWQSQTHLKQPAVVCHLETPLREWAHLESLLREDFDRLCHLDSWSEGERIVCLEWHLTLSDLTTLTLPLRFRHPHALHSEQGVHKTALLQASYCFANSQRAAALHIPLRDGYEPLTALFAVVGWELRITERLTLPRRSISLFDDHSAVEGEEAHADQGYLLRLENKLPIPLIAFDLCPDWLPETSFSEASATKSATTKEVDALTLYAHGLAAAAVSERRPLFLYRHPEPLDPQILARTGRFYERTMHKWWGAAPTHLAGEARVLQRDYYRLRDPQSRSLWVYRDSLGQCFIHGIYG